MPPLIHLRALYFLPRSQKYTPPRFQFITNYPSCQASPKQKNGGVCCGSRTVTPPGIKEAVIQKSEVRIGKKGPGVTSGAFGYAVVLVVTGR
jgi:hypothetical protein